MNTKYVIKLLLVFSLILTSTVCYAGAFFVSTDGNDSNTGSKNSPFKTLQKAIAQVEPGDTIYIREGVYHQQSYIYKSGEPDNYIKIVAYNDEDVVFDGNNELGRFIKVGDWHDREHAHYIWIEGLELRNYLYDGIVSVPGSSNNVFKNIHAHHNGHHAIYTYPDSDHQPGNSGFNLIKNVHAEYNGFHGIKIAGVGNSVVDCIINDNGWNDQDRDGEGLQVSDNNWDVTISGITSFNNRREGIRINANNAHITNIESYNNGRNGLEVSGHANHIHITNAVVYNNNARGISISSNANNVIIKDSNSNDNAHHGLRISDNATKVEVIASNFFDNSLYGILVQDNASHIKITNTNVFRNGSQGILILENISDMEITNSSIHQNGRHGLGLSAREGKNNRIAVSNNLLYGNGSRAFLVSNVSQLTIHSNALYSVNDNIDKEIEYRGDNYINVMISDNILNPGLYPPINLTVVAK